MFCCWHVYSFFRCDMSFNKVTRMHIWFCLFFIQISDDGRYAVLSITEGCEPVNQLWYCDLQQLPDGITGLYEFDFICVIETTRDQFLHIEVGVLKSRLKHQHLNVRVSFLKLISAVLSSRSATMGQTCRQLWGPVLLHHQWGNSVHVPLQSGGSPISSHQHRHPETRAAALDDNHSTAWQGRDGWEHTSFIQRI